MYLVIGFAFDGLIGSISWPVPIPVLTDRTSRVSLDATMPLVKVDAADDYLDVAHLAEDKKGIGSGGAKRRLAGSRSRDAPHGLLDPAGISSMIAPRYLTRDSHARPRDVQVAGPHDSAASLDDNVSVITLETCLRQMEASGTELSEMEMAMAAAMTKKNSEVQGGGGGESGVGGVRSGKVADALEMQSAFGANRSEGRLKDDLGRSGTERSSLTGRSHRQHHKDSSAAAGLHNRSSLQSRYSSNSNVSGRSHLPHESWNSSVSNSHRLHRHLNKHHDSAPATSMRTIESDASAPAVSTAESRTSHRIHKTSEGLGASMWSASQRREDRLKERRRARSRSRERGNEIMKLVLQEEQDEVAAAAAATTEAELERGGAEAREEDRDRPHDGTASLVGSINLQVHNSTTNTLERLSLQSLDDELDDVDRGVEEGASGSVLPPAAVANRMKSASNTLSNLAAEVSSSAERGARGLLSRQSNIDEDGARMIADLESQVDTLREAFQTAEDHVVTLEGKLTDAASDQKKAEDLIRLLEAENKTLKKRVEELERREFGRAMGMTTGRAGMNNTSGILSNDTDAVTKEEDPLKGSLDALRKNRVQPFRQGSVKSIDLESVASVREPPRSTASAATGNSGDSSLPTHDSSTCNQHEEKRSSPTSTAQPQKRGMFGLGKLMSNLHNESSATLETLQEETAQGTVKPGASRGDLVNSPNKVHSHHRPTDDPADVAGESWLRRQRNSIAKGVNESLKNIVTDSSDGASIASHSVVSQGGLSAV